MSSLRTALKAAIAENFDDLATCRTCADRLSEQPKPALRDRGELDHVELELEGLQLRAARRALERREKALLKADPREWLVPELTRYVLDNHPADIELHEDKVSDRATAEHRREPPPRRGRRPTARDRRLGLRRQAAGAGRGRTLLRRLPVRRRLGVEGAPMPDRNSLKRAMEATLVSSPDDLATHMAYADLLTEMGDPRGEFIQVQLALEDPSRPVNERDDLKRREAALLEAHQRDWLGEIADSILLGRDDARAALAKYFGPDSYYLGAEYFRATWRRGWLHSLRLGDFSGRYAEALGRTPAIRLLHHLAIDHSDYEAHGYDALAQLPFLDSLRQFTLGPDDDRCHISGDGIAPAIARMPRLEELRLYAHRVEMTEVFALPMPNLRLLHVYHINTEYPLDVLARNTSLTYLVELSLWPHALEPDDEQAYIQPGPFRTLCSSPYLKSLTHLAVHLSDIGNDGARALVESGLLRRLRVLDLHGGCITDDGARALAACPDLRRLERLCIAGNMLTAEGVAALQATGITLEADNQYDPDEAMEEREYLWEGDCE